MASLPWAMTHPAASMGHSRLSWSMMNAVSCPTVSWPFATMIAPVTRVAPSMTEAMASKADHDLAAMRLLRTPRMRSLSASFSKRSAMSGPRPSALTARMPLADSSAALETSPDWSCSARAAGRKRLKKPRPTRNRGTAATATMSARRHSIQNSCTMMMVVIPAAVMAKTRPPAKKRRIMPRSTVMRARSWPVCQRSWKPVWRRWRCS